MLVRYMRRDLNYSNQPGNIVVRTKNKILVKPEPVVKTSISASVKKETAEDDI